MQKKDYARGKASRAKILDTALETIAQRGFGSTSLAKIAADVGMTSAGLLHHFGSKEDLYVEVLRRRDTVDSRWLPPLGEGAVPSTLQLAHYNISVPGLLHLYVNLSADATDVGHPGHEYFRERYLLVQYRVARDIELRKTDGRFDQNANTEETAKMLIALSDGLQQRWAIDPSSVDILGTLLTFWNYFVPKRVTIEQVHQHTSAAITGPS